MSRLMRLILLAVAALVCPIVAPFACAFDAISVPVAAQGTQQVAFAPWENVEALITTAIDGAKKQVLVQAYLLTSPAARCRCAGVGRCGTIC